MIKSGVVARGIKTPIIKEGDDIVDIVVNSLMETIKYEKIELNDKDVLGITEAVVSISAGNYATVDEIAQDMKKKYKTDHLGILFPILSRNRFQILLKAFSRAFKKLTILLSYPKDEVGNNILDEKKLKELNINPYSDIITEEDYQKHFGDFRHIFTGVNMIDSYRKVALKENCQVNFILSNNYEVIKDYTKDILVAIIHSRHQIKESLREDKSLTVYGLDDIMNESINNSGYNKEYGLLGSNTSTDERVKLFPRKDLNMLQKIQDAIKEKTGKKIEVMVYGDGAFKDPIGGIWELADPVVSPFYTDGLKGSPNEVKIKYLVDNKFGNLSGDDLTKAIKDEIRKKDNNLIGEDISLGTTPRRYVDLLGSLCDLVSGSGDKGTPVVLIQNYFNNYGE
ncbi:coenzyme F420-0:L-glutamate ligase [Acholeplasma sp. OttesenSCG-928-E16]|nr:coenzyme F420-0:L-glutamate ligase [Acholeplasma sp. OttesenSCG-928-E16]